MPTSKSTWLILFDLDGTIIDSKKDILGVLKEVRLRNGYPPLPDDKIVPFIGIGAKHLITHTTQDIKEKPIDLLVKDYRDIYCEKITFGGRPFPNVQSGLLELRKRGHKLGVVTNKPRKVTEITLAHYLPDFQFDTVVCPEDVSEMKPSAEPLLKAINDTQSQASKTFFIGDDTVDKLAANAASVQFIGVGYGIGSLGDDPTSVKSFSEAMDILLKKISPSQ